MKGTTLRELALNRVNVVAAWGRCPLLLIQATTNELTAPFLFDTPEDVELVETSEFQTGVNANDLNSYCLPESVVIPVRKTHRNSFDDVIVGRATNCDIRLSDRTVSKVHAYLKPPADPSGVWLLWEPTASTNGTYVDGMRLDPMARRDAQSSETTKTFIYRIAPGRKLRFGTVECLFLDSVGLDQTLEYAMELWNANGLDWEERYTEGKHPTDKYPRPRPSE